MYAIRGISQPHRPLQHHPVSAFFECRSGLYRFPAVRERAATWASREAAQTFLSNLLDEVSPEELGFEAIEIVQV